MCILVRHHREEEYRRKEDEILKLIQDLGVVVWVAGRS
jgi:hypothetical protein